MAKKLTKNVLPVREYQVWTSANMSAGDLLDVFGSLGGRIADTVTLESNTGNSRVRFNVAREIYAEHGGYSQVSGVLHNKWVGRGKGMLRPAPYLVKEIEDTGMHDIVVENGTTQIWNKSEIGVKDIKVVHVSGLRITVT